MIDPSHSGNFSRRKTLLTVHRFCVIAQFKLNGLRLISDWKTKIMTSQKFSSKPWTLNSNNAKIQFPHVSIHSDKDNSASFRSRDGVERTWAVDECFISHSKERNGRDMILIYPSIKTENWNYYPSHEIAKEKKMQRSNTTMTFFVVSKSSKLKFSILNHWNSLNAASKLWA